MAEEPRPIIIKRVKRIEAAHAGGAWKVAYADFVTAMMAFFLLMWLLGSTTEEQRQGLAEYFAPSVGLPTTTTTGGDGVFGGSSIFSTDRLIHEGIVPPHPAAGEYEGTEDGFADIEDMLLGGSGDAVEADPLLRHIRTRVTDEGLIIEIFDIEDSPLFDGESIRPNLVLNRLVALIGRVLGHTTNAVAVTGHVGSVSSETDAWQLSSGRSHFVREGLVEAGLAPERIARVTGKADRDPVMAEPSHPRNRRIEITLLRRFPAMDEPHVQSRSRPHAGGGHPDISRAEDDR